MCALLYLSSVEGVFAWSCFKFVWIVEWGIEDLPLSSFVCFYGRRLRYFHLYYYEYDS